MSTVDKSPNEEKNKKWNGRKKLPDHLNRKKNKIQVGVTVDEKKIITDNAKKFKLDAAVYLRELGMKSSIKVEKHSKLSGVSDKEMIMQLSKIGNNVNQIARKLNENVKVYNDEIINNQKKLAALIKDILNKMNQLR